jgi:hypothetical protein
LSTWKEKGKGKREEEEGKEEEVKPLENTPFPQVAKISTENLMEDEFTFQNYKSYKETMQQKQQAADK